MKRDIDLIREPVAHMEADSRLDGSHYVIFDKSEFKAYSQDEIGYHVDLLFEADFVKGIATLDGPAAAVSRLTWKGHEFLADTRDPGVPRDWFLNFGWRFENG